MLEAVSLEDTLALQQDYRARKPKYNLQSLTVVPVVVRHGTRMRHPKPESGIRQAYQ